MIQHNHREAGPVVDLMAFTDHLQAEVEVEAQTAIQAWERAVDEGGAGGGVAIAIADRTG